MQVNTYMGQNVVPYAYGRPIRVCVYGTSHTRIGQYTHMGQNSIINMCIMSKKTLFINKDC